MKLDVYKIKTPAFGYLFLPHGSELPQSIKRPGGVAIKPWKTTDLTAAGERIGLTDEERLAVVACVTEHGQATMTPLPKPRRQLKA